MLDKNILFVHQNIGPTISHFGIVKVILFIVNFFRICIQFNIYLQMTQISPQESHPYPLKSLNVQFCHNAHLNICLFDLLKCTTFDVFI